MLSDRSATLSAHQRYKNPNTWNFTAASSLQDWRITIPTLTSTTPVKETALFPSTLVFVCGHFGRFSVVQCFFVPKMEVFSLFYSAFVKGLLYFCSEFSLSQ